MGSFFEKSPTLLIKKKTAFELCEGGHPNTSRLPSVRRGGSLTRMPLSYFRVSVSVPEAI